MNASELLTNEVGGLDKGTEFTTRGRTVTETDLVNFSALTGDWHPQHSDSEWASRSRFSRRIAHGMLVLSYAVGLLPLDPERVVALRGLGSVTFKRPVAIGDTIRAHCRVESTRPVDETQALARLTIRVLNQDDRVVVLATLEAICKTAPRASINGAAKPAATTGPIGQPNSGSGFWSDEMIGLYGEEMCL